jgi:hypothetical protein
MSLGESLPAAACGALFEPTLELGDGNQDHLRTAADDSELGLDMLVEEVPADAEHLGGLDGSNREARESGP